MYKDILALESNPIQISKLEDLTHKLVEEYALPSDKYAPILICLTEAVSNAIVHGNKYDASKQVWIRMAESSDFVVIQVSDQGEGFDYTQLPDPTIPENLESPGGRGIFVIKALCDRCEFETPGNVINMHFNRS